jgi:hypothetical protein
VADGQDLPDRWSGETRENVLWRTAIPGLAHSSPIVWGDRLFVTSAISTRGDATFKPGQYGSGDASDDRSPQRWMLYALDRRSGEILWERTAHESEPIDKRHIKSTYASSTPATDGRVVVAWFGSQGVHAYTVEGAFLWKVDLGRVDVGPWDAPTLEWGPASSPIIWTDLVILHVDRQADSFLIALGGQNGRSGLDDRAERAAFMEHAHAGRHDDGSGAHHERGQLHSRLRSTHRSRAVATPWRHHGPDPHTCRHGRSDGRREQQPRPRPPDLRRPSSAPSAI